jgi:hypothetical protein
MLHRTKELCCESAISDFSFAYSEVAMIVALEINFALWGMIVCVALKIFS